MKTVQPLRDSSNDLAQVIGIILRQEPLDDLLVQKALLCYRTWVEYAVRGEEVKIETLFP